MSNQRPRYPSEATQLAPRPGLSRRRWLQHAAAFTALTATGVSGRLYAASPDGPRFLLVFLRGGYDSTNMLIPHSSSFYYEARPTIAIARPKPEDPAGALELDSDWALAPALRDSIGPLYQQRQAAFIPFAGTEDLSRSHFETQDSIELGQPAQGSHDFRSGFLARLHQTITSAAAISFTDSLPLAFQGSGQIPNLSLKSVGKPPFDDRQVAILDDMYAGHPLESAVSSGLELRRDVAQTMQKLEQEMNDAGRNAISIKGFELEAQRIARLMRDQYRVGFVDIGGWDTHVNEGAGQGQLATNLAGLGQGLAVFAQALGAEWKNTVVVVLSEFGRTFRENGNHGTDHGHGTVYWVLGGSIGGGRIAGEQQKLERATLFQDRDYPVLNDYRAVLGGLFRSMWGLSPEQCTQVFPQITPVDLKLV
ncbi:MAG TPA: DUF1501 domain-containing protein [Steroidobacteraceae bacterium]|jgi:uncharacterized protein (DUF1501 family)